MVGKYDDIINLEHPTSKKHKRMSIEDRAAQFGAFAALVGYGDAINETKKEHLKKYEEKNKADPDDQPC